MEAGAPTVETHLISGLLVALVLIHRSRRKPSLEKGGTASWLFWLVKRVTWGATSVSRPGSRMHTFRMFRGQLFHSGWDPLGGYFSLERIAVSGVVWHGVCLTLLG